MIIMVNLFSYMFFLFMVPLLEKQGWGSLKLCSLISLLGIIFILKNYNLICLDYIYIWQATLQLSCGGTCQIWTWYSLSKPCFHSPKELDKLQNGRNWVSNPHCVAVQASGVVQLWSTNHRQYKQSCFVYISRQTISLGNSCLTCLILGNTNWNAEGCCTGLGAATCIDLRILDPVTIKRPSFWV